VLFLAHILPPRASIILLEINRPRPVPPASDFVVNFENSLGNISGSIPTPVSFTEILTTLSNLHGLDGEMN
jgi:hypothetical protein